VSPFDSGLLGSGISADSFIINKIIYDSTNKNIALGINYILGVPFFLKLPLELYVRGFIKGFGFIPVGSGRKSFHNIFLKSVKRAVSQRLPILIYPSGTRSDDFYGTEELKAGAAYIALKYNMPIVPSYIKGSNCWDRVGQKVDLAFGKPFSPKGFTVDGINEKIKKEMLQLKARVNKSSL
ncbi:MAG: 1-acyl-sn-glycerol-3-phosphate acyltransferase, partial [Patescibacteria group bacterium]|nr:1-acyl-sn-glycerol-3-phosphate acyltransferase [Patescibacteria group bacterium]